MSQRVIDGGTVEPTRTIASGRRRHERKHHDGAHSVYGSAYGDHRTTGTSTIANLARTPWLVIFALCGGPGLRGFGLREATVLVFLAAAAGAAFVAADPLAAPGHQREQHPRVLVKQVP